MTSQVFLNLAGLFLKKDKWNVAVIADIGMF